MKQNKTKQTNQNPNNNKKVQICSVLGSVELKNVSITTFHSGCHDSFIRKSLVEWNA